MQLFNAQQIHEWDVYTIEREQISSIDLMERAAEACEGELMGLIGCNYWFYIFCGKGNNGGDGLALARLLSESDCQVKVFELFSEKSGSPDFETNKQHLQQLKCDIQPIKSPVDFPSVPESAVIIDALFGSGLNKPLEGIAAELVRFLNHLTNRKIAIDIPSGMFPDQSSKGNVVLEAQYTFTFQRLKFCLLLPENAPFFGEIFILDIGLSENYHPKEASGFSITNLSFVQKIYRPRGEYGNKGTFGHALLAAGNKGKMGAAILAATACLRSGVGLLTCNIPESESLLLPAVIPEAMSVFREAEIDFSKYNSIGIGPGLGTEEKQLLKNILEHAGKPLVLDADALNMLAHNPDWLRLVPSDSILSPHPKEFDRLFGAMENDAVRIRKAIALSLQYPFTLILKGHNTFIAHQGKGYFNTTGNAGMATGGSGDTLTGILTGLLAQGYNSFHAAILGVYLHGLAGDLALEEESEESLLPSDLISCLGKAFRKLRAGTEMQFEMQSGFSFE